MSARTPAGQLARLRERHGAHWRIHREPGHQQEAASGPGYIGPATWTAVRRDSGLVLRETSAAELERKLISAEAGLDVG